MKPKFTAVKEAELHSWHAIVLNLIDHGASVANIVINTT